MNPITTAKIAQIGNSKGIRIKKEILEKYSLETHVTIEETPEGLLIKPKKAPEAVNKLSWEDTFKEMAKANEDWSEWDCTIADGLDEVPWEE